MRTYITAAAVLALSTGASLADYPERGITMIVAWAAGGGTDAIARTVAAGLEEELGVNVTVVNRDGGSGVIGHTAMVNADPDGYTIGFASADHVLLEDTMRKAYRGLNYQILGRHFVTAPG